MFKDGEAKELFGITELMRDLVRTWVPFPWAPHVEVSAMQRLSAEHVSEVHDETGALTHRHGDVAWLVEVSRVQAAPVADTHEAAGEHASPEGHVTGTASPGANTVVDPLCNVLVMLEVQHEPMASMPLRVLEYVSLAMSRSFKLHREVTPVLPVVLYTGVRPWAMERSVRPLIRYPEVLGDPFTADLSYVLLELGTLPLPPVEHAEALNLATELVRVCTQPSIAELAPALARLMMVAEARGELQAADQMASRLALSLARRHGQRPMGRKVDNMKALIRQTDEWLYQPGVDDFEKMIEEERELRVKEQALRLEEQRRREEEQRRREEVQLRLEQEQRRMLRRLHPGLSREELASLDADEVATRVDALLGEDD